MNRHAMHALRSRTRCASRLSPITPSELILHEFHAPHWAKVVSKYGPIDNSMAHVLADKFKNHPAFWLGIQSQYNAELDRDLLDKDAKVC